MNGRRGLADYTIACCRLPFAECVSSKGSTRSDATSPTTIKCCCLAGSGPVKGLRYSVVNALIALGRAESARITCDGP